MTDDESPEVRWLMDEISKSTDPAFLKFLLQKLKARYRELMRERVSIVKTPTPSERVRAGNLPGSI